MAVASSPSSVSDGDLSSEQAVTSHIQSQPVTPLPTTKPVVTRGLPLLAYLPIPRLSNNQPQVCCVHIIVNVITAKQQQQH